MTKKTSPVQNERTISETILLSQACSEELGLKLNKLHIFLSLIVFNIIPNFYEVFVRMSQASFPDPPKKVQSTLLHAPFK